MQSSTRPAAPAEPRSTAGRTAAPPWARVGLVTAAVLGATVAMWSSAGAATVTQPRLLSAANETVMGASAITNTGPTVINGNLAISPNDASSVTGFVPGQVTGASNYDDAVADQAQTDLVTTYNDATGATATRDLTGVDLGGLRLTPGVYHFDTSAQLTGTLTLDGLGSTNATFIFQIGTTLTTADASRVVLLNGAGACAVFWQVGSSATLGTTTSFQGNLIALTSITMTTGATMGVGGGLNGGRALAMNGALTLDSNLITPPPPGCAFTAAPATPTATPTPTPAPAVPGVPSTGGAAGPAFAAPSWVRPS